MKKIARTYRIDKETDNKIKELKKLWKSQMGFTVSESDIINILVKNEYKTYSLDLFKD